MSQPELTFPEHFIDAAKEDGATHFRICVVAYDVPGESSSEECTHRVLVATQCDCINCRRFAEAALVTALHTIKNGELQLMESAGATIN